jgi:hypothetical protein
MKRAIICLPILLLFAQMAAANADGQTNDAVVDVAEKRAEIRQHLLKYTPLGSSTGEVMTFIRARLPNVDESALVVSEHPAEGPSAETSGKRGVRVIKLDLSDPRMNPFLSNFSAPMPDESGMAISLFPFGIPVENTPPLFIQWAFDSQDHLLEIFLDRNLKEP